MRMLSRMETLEDIQAREARERDEDVRKARISAARKCSAWEEITPPERLVPRGPARFGWMVDAESDAIYVLHGGSVFQPRTAQIIADKAPLKYTISGGHVLVYERLRKPKTWSDVIRSNPELAT